MERFITPSDASVQQTIDEVTGGWSNASDWDEYWTDIDALYDWVVSSVPYNYDGLFPVLPSARAQTLKATNSP